MAACTTYDLCIEVVLAPGDPNTVLIRESKYPDAWVRTPTPNWLAFVEGVKNGDFDNVTSPEGVLDAQVLTTTAAEQAPVAG